MKGVSPSEEKRALVAIDLGGESCRVSLLRWQGDEPRIDLVHRFPNAAVQRAEGLRWDMAGILRGLHEGLRMCAARAPEGIAAVAVDGWAVDYVRLDEKGQRVADPFCYRDIRTAEGEHVLHARLSAERMRELTGIQILPLNTAYQLTADEPGMRRLRWLNLPEYVLFTLGGRPVAELTNASHTQLMALDATWAQEICTAVGTPASRAAEIVQPGTDLGVMQGELAGLPEFLNTRLIAPACHDTASAIAAVPDDGDDWAYISSGTWSLVGTMLREPVNTAAACAANFANLRGAGGAVCFHKNVNGMWLLRQCMDTWKAEGREFTYAQLTAAAAAVPARSYVLDVDEAELLLPGDMPGRINAQLQRRGLEILEPSAEGPAVMASFLFHSLAARYAEVLRTLSEITGKRLRKLYIMGGGSQNDLLNRLAAGTTGLEVRRAGTECSTVGNFAVQLAALQQGRPPDAKAVAAWALRLAAQAQ